MELQKEMYVTSVAAAKIGIFGVLLFTNKLIPRSNPVPARISNLLLIILYHYLIANLITSPSNMNNYQYHLTKLSHEKFLIVE